MRAHILTDKNAMVTYFDRLSAGVTFSDILNSKASYFDWDHTF